MNTTAVADEANQGIDSTATQSQPSPTYQGLWQLTEGERLRYAWAILAMAFTNMCMFGAPIIAGQTIDVITLNDFAHANSLLAEISTWFSRALFGFEEISKTVYLWSAALACLLITVIGGVFLYVRGRLAAMASENIARRLRESLYSRLHNLNARFF